MHHDVCVCAVDTSPFNLLPLLPIESRRFANRTGDGEREAEVIERCRCMKDDFPRKSLWNKRCDHLSRDISVASTSCTRHVVVAVLHVLMTLTTDP